MAGVGIRYKDWKSDDNLMLLECWARDFSLIEIAKKIGISDKSLWEWRRKYPEVDQALKRGAEIVDYQVENTLLKCALGYETKEVLVVTGYPDKDGNRKTRTEVTTKEVQPNVTACMAWLNNRRPDKWKRNRDNVLTQEDKDNNITINIIKKGSSNKNGEKESDDDEWDVSATAKNSNNKNNEIKNGEKSIKKSRTKKSNEEEWDDGSWPDEWEE